MGGRCVPKHTISSMPFARAKHQKLERALPPYRHYFIVVVNSRRANFTPLSLCNEVCQRRQRNIFEAEFEHYAAHRRPRRDMRFVRALDVHGCQALSIIEKYNATLSVLNDTHGKTCAVFFYTNVRCNATASNCITLANSTDITNSSQVNATNSSLTNNTANNGTTSAHVPKGEYRRKCYICPLATFVNQTNGGCSFIPCNATKQYGDGYCIANVTTDETPVVIDVTKVVYTNESLALINILSTFILENDSYVMWNLIFAVTVLTYVCICPGFCRSLSLLASKPFCLAKIKI